MLLLITVLLLLAFTGIGYYFSGKQGAIGTFLTLLFLFGLPAIIYSMQSN
ncbi:MAG: hypothetical protein Q9M39_10340 [Sulfurovum sp.]|nr:hypothetical protein [Sulfurovum sp.]